MSIALGIDLCNDYTACRVFGTEDDEAISFPTVVCKNKKTGEWEIGEEAYRMALSGEGVIVDKLLKLAKKDGTATIDDIKYEASELLKIYLGKLIGVCLKKYGDDEISRLVVTIKELNKKLMDTIKDAGTAVGLSGGRIHIISHTESFVYYVLSRPKELYNNQVALFDCSSYNLRYYEMKVIRGVKNVSVMAEGKSLEEAFNTDILKNEAGRRLADHILRSCAEKLMSKKIYSSVFLTGEAFNTGEWGEEFFKFICSRRRVGIEPGLFALGAAVRADDFNHGGVNFPYAVICEGNLPVDISMSVTAREQDTRLLLARAGDPWYETTGHVELIPAGQDYVDIHIEAIDKEHRTRLIRIPLEGFPERPDRTTRIGLDISFPDAGKMEITINDMGFGELYPKSGAMIHEEIDL